jgi:hypothetical protein
VATPTVALSPLSDSGYSSSDSITNVTTPRFTTADATAGTTVVVYLNGVAYTGQTLAAGSYTVTAVATDQYGNVSSSGTAPKTLVIVTSPPSGSWTVSGGVVINGVLSTSSKTPTLTLSFSDPGGVYQTATSTNGGATWTATAAYATSTTISLSNGDGSYTVLVKVIDAAGNFATYAQTVRLDTTGPTVSASLSAPQGSYGYDGTSNITIASSASDGSGVAALNYSLDGGAAFTSTTINIYTLLAGSHSLVVKATDGLGNVTTTTLTFQVHPGLIGLEDAVKVGTTSGAITSSEQTKLLSLLTNTANSLATRLANFLTEVKNQSGKAITSSEASFLTNWGQDLSSYVAAGQAHVVFAATAGTVRPAVHAPASGRGHRRHHHKKRGARPRAHARRARRA